MLNLRFVVWFLPVCLVILGAGVVFGQDYPNKPIRIFTNVAGGGNDLQARMIGQGISGPLGQPVIVDNRPVFIAAATAAKSPPDGYTLLLGGAGMWLAPYLQSNVPWDPIKDFLPITMTSRAPNILVVHPSLPVKSVKELIALAKARPGELNYATPSSTPGGSPHLAAELFKSMAQVNLVMIPYKGLGLAFNSLIGGETQVMFPTANGAMPYVKVNKLKALAITSAQRTPQLPDLPTVSASGLPGYETEVLIGLFAPARTPVAIINRLNQEMVRFLNTKDTRQKYQNLGADVVANSPEEFAAAMKTDMTTLGKVIRDLGLHAQ